MTVEEILNASLALCGERNPFPAVQELAVSWVNELLAEVFPAECSAAEAKGETVPENIGSVAALEDAVPCNDELCRGAMVNGFAAYICDIGDDRTLAAEYRKRFREAVYRAAKANEHVVADCY